MKSIVHWAIKNTPAMNTLMLGILAIGIWSLFTIRRELFPEFDLEIIQITVPYPGASPDDVENSICERVEEAVSGIDGIKTISSSASEGFGTVTIELKSSIGDVQRALNEVRSEVDQLASFPPPRAEDADIKQITLRTPAITVGVLGPENAGPDGPLKLRNLAEQIRDEMILLPSIAVADIQGARAYQIDVEIPEKTLRKYGLTLREVANILRRENIEMPGGVMRTDSQEILLRGKNKRYTGEEIAKIPLVRSEDGVILTVGDLGNVRDEFVDDTFESHVDGKPALAITVQKTATEDLLKITEEVKKYREQRKLPPGYEFRVWQDVSLHVDDRLNLLAKNGLQGLALVLIVLAIFLEKRLAFWVALGIPISMLGTIAVMYFIGATLNMISMFAFLMALGILVDDAIVIGENVYSHRQFGKSFVRAAIDGTAEVMPSVTASVTTTIIAFTPLLFVPDVMGKFIAVMPVAVILMLMFSLFEGIFILSCHLAHGNDPQEESAKPRRTFFGPVWTKVAWMVLAVMLSGIVLAVVRADLLPTQVREKWPEDIRNGIELSTYQAIGLGVFLYLLMAAPFLGPVLRTIGSFIDWVNKVASKYLFWFIDNLYVPTLNLTLRYRWVAVSIGVAILIISAGVIRSGLVPFVGFPKMDSPNINAVIVYPDGTPRATTEKAIQKIEQTFLDMAAEFEAKGMPICILTTRTVGSAGAGTPGLPASTGSSVGNVTVELVGPEERNLTSQEIVELWRDRAGNFPGAESVKFASAQGGPGGKDIEFVLMAQPEDMDKLNAAIEEAKEHLRKKEGVFDIIDNSQPGKWEYQLSKLPKAETFMDVTTDSLAGTVRSHYYGEEVMRLQRGRHEVKLMVRYPPEEREKLSHFNEIRERVGDAEIPITELADKNVDHGYSTINRLHRKRAISISADVKAGVGNASDITRDMKKDFFPKLFEKYPELTISWEGQNKRTTESVIGLAIGLSLALVAMFVLLTLEFQSYFQPALIMCIIPFGIVGAVIGHIFFVMPLTLFSLFGLVAMTGVVVNDSIVLIDFINIRVRDGLPLREALVDAGRRRFRPVMLTSVTTVCGLLPLLLESSFQAQVLKPMAVSLSFGLIFATFFVLLLIPAFYLIYARIAGVGMDRPDELEQEGAIQHVASQAQGTLAAFQQDLALEGPGAAASGQMRALPDNSGNGAPGTPSRDQETAGGEWSGT